MWIDLTVRPTGDPEIDVNPATNEFEFSWTLADNGRLTILMSQEAVDKATSKARSLLAILPAQP